jgi:hypothetical protein
VKNPFGREMSIPPELIDIILNQFQSVLKENRMHPWEPKHGNPPKYGYIEQKEWTENSHGNEPGIAAWYISEEIRKPSKLKGWGTPKIDGMFYDFLRGWFYFSPDMSLVHINWQIGPRFGRGSKHRFGTDSLGKYLLDQGENTWVS